jgi:hypothetical protein
MLSQHYAPIALFAYKRPEHLRRTLAALKANPIARQSMLYVFADGPKNESDATAVAEVRNIVAEIEGFAEVRVFARETNAGLARSIIEGVTRVINDHKRVIVIEDDLIVAPCFLQYMNDALAMYADDGDVASIHAYVYPVEQSLPDTFFLKGADCWGWATWDRAWSAFEPDGAKLLDGLMAPDMAYEFDLDGSYPYTQMLRDQVAGKNDSWAIRWHASSFLAEKLTLYPGRSLVQNIGHDSSGTHCEDTERYSVAMAEDLIGIQRIPLREDARARAAFGQFLRQSTAGTSHAIGLRRRVTEALKWLR